MQRLTIARFDPVRTANIVAALYAVIVLVFGALFAIPFGLLALVAGGRSGQPGLAGGGLIGVLFLLLIAVVFYAAVGWVLTALTCALYNWLARRMGGIQVDVRQEMPAYGGQPIPAWGAQSATPAIGLRADPPGIAQPPMPGPDSVPPAPAPGSDTPPQPPTGWGGPR
jgi:hypothetical protein